MRLQLSQNLEVGGLLLRHFADMLQPKILKFGFLRLQILSGFLQLVVEKLRSSGGLLLARLRFSSINRDASSFVTCATRRGSLPRYVMRNASRSWLPPPLTMLHINVRSASFDHVFADHGLSFFRIEIESIDDLLQSCGAQNLLRKRAQPVAHIAANRWPYITFRDFLRVHQDRRVRS